MAKNPQSNENLKERLLELADQSLKYIQLNNLVFRVGDSVKVDQALQEETDLLYLISEALEDLAIFENEHQVQRFQSEKPHEHSESPIITFTLK